MFGAVFVLTIFVVVLLINTVTNNKEYENLYKLWAESEEHNASLFQQKEAAEKERKRLYEDLYETILELKDALDTLDYYKGFLGRKNKTPDEIIGD